MAHKTLVDGTAYDVKGGRCLVGGTGYSIQKGRTKVDGTGYDVSFPAAVTISGSGNAAACYAIINGTTYTSAADGIEVQPGDVMIFGVLGNGSTSYGSVTIDNNMVWVVEEAIESTYSWTVPDGISQIEISLYCNLLKKYGRITVKTS